MTADTTTTITTTTTADAAPSPPPPRANIAIVGGGIAGLRAAQTLLSTSTHLHVTILEARNRLGGRIHSVPVPGTDDAWVDMGPNWLHGASTHPLLPLLKAEAGKRRETVVVDVEDLIGGAGYIPPPHDPSSPVKREDREKWEKDAAEMDALTWEVIGAAVGYSRMYYYAGRDEKSRVGVLEEKKENMLADENEDKKMVVEKEWDFEIDPRWSLLDFCDVMAEGKFGPLPSGESILSEHGLQDKPAEEGDNSREAKADEIWKREKLRILHFLHQNELLPTSPTPTPSPQRHHLLLDMMTMFSSYVGTHVSRQSLRNMLLEAGPGDDSNLFVASTYRSILEYVEANIREKMQNGKNGEVRLCRKAVGVRNLYAQGNREGGVVVRVKKVDADGNEEGKEEELHFDACILTLPLGVLKYITSPSPASPQQPSRDFFTPPLPPRVLSAIHSLNYGNLEKLYLTFPSAWWLSPSSNNPPTSPAVFTFPSSTTHMIFSLFHLPPPLSHPTLLCYLYPPLSDRMFLPTPISPDYVSSLISLLPNYSPTNPSCTPTSVIATGWSKDEFAGWGSYTNFQVGLKDGVRELQVLKGFGSSGAEGGNQGEWENGGVWFAGEHVAPDERSLATVGGAWESGEEVARRVVKWLEERAKLP